MALVVVSRAGLRRQDMEGAYSGSNIGSGAGGGEFTEAVFQGTQSWGRKIGATDSERGFTTSITSTSTANKGTGVLVLKGHLVNSSVISTIANGGGVRHRIGSSTTNYNEYLVASLQDTNEKAFPYGDQIWKITHIDPSVTAWIHAQPASAPTLTAITDIAITGAITVTTINENIIFDAIDFSERLFLIRGDGAFQTDGAWQDFVDFDATERIGHIVSQEGILFCYGGFQIGRDSGPSSAATEFTDKLRTIVFPGGQVDAGYNKITYYLDTTSTMTLSNMSYTGRGRAPLKCWFDTELDVDGTNNTVGFNFGDPEHTSAILYSKEGGVEDIGLTDATEYWLQNGDGSFDNEISSTYAGSFITSNTPVNLTASVTASGENHLLTQQPDTRPVYEVIGTTGSLTETGSIFQRFAAFDLTSAASFIGCSFVQSSAMNLNGATLESCIITDPAISEGEVFLETGDLSDITNSEFTKTDGLGHAIEITASGVFTFTGNSFNNYWSHSGDPGTGTRFHTTDNVDGGTDVITTIAAHGLDAVNSLAVFYSDEGGSATPIDGGVSGNKYYVNILSTTTFSLHKTYSAALADVNRIPLTSAGSEIHAFYSGEATILNSSGGNVQIDIVGGDGVTVRNLTNADTATVNVSVPVEVNGLTEGSYAAIYGSAAPQLGNELLSGYADSTGKITGSFSGTTPQAVSVRARNAGIVSAVIQDDGGAFTDFTLAARNRTSPGGGAADDVDLLPATVSVGDALYIAGLAEFGEVELDVSTAGDTYVLTWEYWNGAWVALTVVDGTNSFQTAGWNKITFTKPGDWATTSINSQGPFFYIRARVTTGGGTQPRGETFTLGDTIKYKSFNGTGTIATTTGLTSTAVWEEDTNNP